MTTAQPGPLTPAETGELLATGWQLPPGASLAEQTAFLEWKAGLLSRIAASFDTPEAHAVAVEARDHAAAIVAKAREATKAQP